MKLWKGMWLSSLVLLAGCVRSTNPRPAFEEVQGTVCGRSGYQIHWDRQGAGLSADDCVDQLLHAKLNMETAVRIALFNNPQLQGIYEELGIAQADLVQAGLLCNPILAASYRPSTVSGTSALLDAGIIQNVLEALLIPLKRKLAASELAATKARVAGEVLGVIATTKIAFFTLQAAEQTLPLAEQAVLTADAAYDAASRLHKAGNLTDLELVSKRSFYENTKVALANVEETILELREKLNQLMGLWGRQLEWQALEGLPAIGEYDDEWLGVENRAIANSLDLAMERRLLCSTAAHYGIDTARLVFPELSAGISAEREEGTWFVGPAFSVPLPLFDVGQAVSARARAAIMRQWQVYTARAVEIRSEARRARIRMLNARRQSRYYDQVLVPLTERVLRETLLQHNAMQLGVFHLLDAKQDEIDKRIASVAWLRDFWIAHARLDVIINGHLLMPMKEAMS